MAKELSANSMGKMLIGKISYIYIETGTMYLGGLKSVGSHFSKWSHNWEVKKNLIK